ncbi:MAG TPA: aminotransferase class I/II-fold pyridoxal phosphate-dependent enzyme [Bacilli bacterium]|nr:aminotransferase class I/II-fold pyridoxal phosphate-dependent enzyme [Bacilli bacterium]HPZ27530.1 aminotransferase class I/II-fold pyridoxal phosphate-dependent enzyme [Bacilli bacterium]HQC89804.1 aminotransferase class I/II-fold pyridoxal phosphate-dependent enzyme [Bacilli bacterium]
MDLFKKIKSTVDQIDAAKEQGIYPYFHALETGQDTEVHMYNRRVIMIGSNNYLGLTSHPEVKEAAIAAIEKYGSGCSGSRFLNGTLDIHLALEEELADFLRKEAVMTFSTGFQSNLGIISAIAGRNDYIVSDKENHASIYDACRLSYAKLLRFKHNDMEDLEKKLASIESDKGILIVTDGVFSMTGDICNLPEIVRLAKKYGARVMVDDAHGLGVLGAGGRGTAEYFDLEDEVDIYMGTFSKSLASLGGYMAASRDVVEYVKHVSRPFIFSASITPASVEAARAALRIIRREPERVKALHDISSYMREGLKKLGVDIIESQTPIIPIYTYEDEKTFIACKLLLERGVYVNPVISPATPPGQSLLRTSYTATHTREQMDHAMRSIKEVLEILKNYA